MMERPSTFWWQKSRCSGAAQHFLFGIGLRDGGLVHVLNENQRGKQKHSKQLKKYSGKGNQEKRHTLG